MHQLIINGNSFSLGDTGRAIAAGVTTAVILATPWMFSNEAEKFVNISENEVRVSKAGKSSFALLAAEFASYALGLGLAAGTSIVLKKASVNTAQIFLTGIGYFNGFGASLTYLPSEYQLAAGVAALGAGIGFTAGLINVEMVFRLRGNREAGEELAGIAQKVAESLGMGIGLGFQNLNLALFAGLGASIIGAKIVLKGGDLTAFALTKFADYLVR